MTNLIIPAKDGGSFNSYISFPENVSRETKYPAVIVIQEIFGINEGIRKKCNWLSSQGFIAIAPDLFWRIQPDIELSDQIPEELERAFELFSQFDVDAGVEDLKSTLDIIKTHTKCSGDVGALGYCLGGKLAYLLACRSKIKASIGYYGVGIEELLADANNISGELMLHIAEKDEFVPPEAQHKILDALLPKNNVIIHTYPDMNHAFTREGGDNYNSENAELADSHSIYFLKTHLK